MKKHTSVYLKSMGLAGQDNVAICEKCRRAQSVDIHHIKYRSAGGTDDLENLIGLCRPCHNKAHDGTIGKEVLLKIAARRVERNGGRK